MDPLMVSGMQVLDPQGVGERGREYRELKRDGGGPEWGGGMVSTGQLMLLTWCLMAWYRGAAAAGRDPAVGLEIWGGPGGQPGGILEEGSGGSPGQSEDGEA